MMSGFPVWPDSEVHVTYSEEKWAICDDTNHGMAKKSGAAGARGGAAVPLLKPFGDEPGGAADPGIDFKGGGGAVLRTGAAFHAGIKV
jgi:hypothetical protein